MLSPNFGCIARSRAVPHAIQVVAHGMWMQSRQRARSQPMIRLRGLRKTDEYSWGSYEADASLTIVNVTAAVSDRSRAERPPRLIAYAYVQRRAGTGVTAVSYTHLTLPTKA